MNVPAFFLALAGVLLTLALYALWRSLRVAFGVPAEIFAGGAARTDRAALVDEKNALLRSLKDLDYEREVGKIDVEDYERLKQRYRRRAKEILRLLDQDIEPYLREAGALIDAHLKGKAGDEGEGEAPAPKKAGKNKKRRRRKEPTAGEPSVEEPSVEEGSSGEATAEEGSSEEAAAEAPSAEEDSSEEAAAEEDSEAGPKTCPSCETVNDPDARFCKSCAHDFHASKRERADA